MGGRGSSSGKAGKSRVQVRKAYRERKKQEAGEFEQTTTPLHLETPVRLGSKYQSIPLDVNVTFSGKKDDVNLANSIAEYVLGEHFKLAANSTARLGTKAHHPNDEAARMRERKELKAKGVKISNPESVFKFYASRYSKNSALGVVMSTKDATELINKFKKESTPLGTRYVLK